MIKNKTAGLVFIVFSVLPSLALSMVLDATWSNALAFQKDRIDTTRPLLGYDENLVLSCKKINQSDVSFFSNIDYMHGYASPGKHRFEVTNAYFDWSPTGSPLDLRMGRQLNYDGNTPVYLDGVKLQGAIKDQLVITGAGGRPVASRYSKETFVSRIDTTDIDLTLRADYLFASSRAGVIYQQQTKTSGKLNNHDIGLFLSHDFTDKWYARGNVAYNITAATINNFQITTSYQWSDKLLLNALGSKEAWKTDSSSVFEKKIYKSYEEGGLCADYSMSDTHTGSLTMLIRRFNSSDLGAEFSGRFYCEPFTLALRQDLGFGGPVSMADISATHRCTRLLSSTVCAGVVRYESPGQDALTNLAYSSSISLDLRPETSPFGMNIETQLMRNQYYKYDVRAYINTIYQFSKFYK